MGLQLLPAHHINGILRRQRSNLDLAGRLETLASSCTYLPGWALGPYLDPSSFLTDKFMLLLHWTMGPRLIAGAWVLAEYTLTHLMVAVHESRLHFPLYTYPYTGF